MWYLCQYVILNDFFLKKRDQVIDKSPNSLFLQMSHDQHLMYFCFIQYFHSLTPINYDKAGRMWFQI